MKTESEALLSLRAKYQAKIALIDETLAELGSPVTNSIHPSTPSGRKPMSQAARDRIAAIARARWKKAKAQGKKTF